MTISLIKESGQSSSDSNYEGDDHINLAILGELLNATSVKSCSEKAQNALISLQQLMQEKETNQII